MLMPADANCSVSVASMPGRLARCTVNSVMS
jgi:hypothetical protein